MLGDYYRPEVGIHRLMRLGAERGLWLTCMFRDENVTQRTHGCLFIVRIQIDCFLNGTLRIQQLLSQ